MYIPDQGDLVILSFSPQAGREQRGRRPGLVISKKAFNERCRLAFICPMTTPDKSYPFHLSIPEGLKASGFVMVDQARSLDYNARDVAFCDKVPEDFLSKVLDLFYVIFY